jgi:hypothetical protein
LELFSAEIKHGPLRLPDLVPTPQSILDYPITAVAELRVVSLPSLCAAEFLKAERDERGMRQEENKCEKADTYHRGYNYDRPESRI